jgi:hypothetical protein
MAFRDLDGDGYDDSTGESRQEYESRARREANDADAEGRAASAWANGDYGDAPAAGDPSAAPGMSYDDQQRANRDSAQGAVGASGDRGAYVSPNQDSDAGLGVASPYETDQALEGTFLLGDLGGSNARMAAYRRNRQEAEKQGWIDQAQGFVPSADDLWVQYEEEGSVDGPQRSELADARADTGAVSAQMDALRALQNVYERGGMTDADRARQQLARMHTGQAVRGQRDADLNALEARGMGGSGAALAARLGGQQYGAQALAQQDAQMLVEAQRRALDAMSQAGSLGSQARGQSFNESATRRTAADDFNRYQTDYQREREQRNTAYRNRTRESRAESRQGAYENRRDLAAMRTGQYAPTRDPNDVADDSNERTGGFLGGLLSTIAGS